MANHEATSYVMVHGECLDVLNRLLRTSAHEGLHEQVTSSRSLTFWRKRSCACVSFWSDACCASVMMVNEDVLNRLLRTPSRTKGKAAERLIGIPTVLERTEVRGRGFLRVLSYLLSQAPQTRPLGRWWRQRFYRTGQGQDLYNGFNKRLYVQTKSNTMCSTAFLTQKGA
jgi:hypothetical protein